MRAKLRINRKSDESEEVSDLTVAIGNTATIGRSPHNTIVLPNCSRTSREHAVIRDHGEDLYYLMDLGSANGTFLDGSQVVLPSPVPIGSVIEIGSYILHMEEADSESDEQEQAATFPRETQRTVRTEVDVTLMVCDLRGFSRASESQNPHAIGRLLGKWFRTAGKCIRETGGTVDRFLGDAFIACWTDRGHTPDTNAALQAVRELSRLASQFTWQDDQNTPFRLRFALHHGTVSVENIGTVPLRDATIIGDAVNTVCKLEAWMKSTPFPCACTDAFASRLVQPHPVPTLVETLALPGRTMPSKIFRIEITDDPPSTRE